MGQEADRDELPDTAGLQLQIEIESLYGSITRTAVNCLS